MACFTQGTIIHTVYTNNFKFAHNIFVNENMHKYVTTIINKRCATSAEYVHSIDGSIITSAGKH